MKQEILRMIQDDLGYYHSVGYQEYTEPLFILEMIFHDLPGVVLAEFFSDAVIDDHMSGNDFGAVKKIGENRALISIFNFHDEEGPDYEYEIDIDRMLKLVKQYEKLQAQRPDEIFFKKIGNEISIEGHFKNKPNN